MFIVLISAVIGLKRFVKVLDIFLFMKFLSWKLPILK